MQRTPRSFDTAVLVLVIGAPVIIWLTDRDAGWHSMDGRTSLALRSAWGIAVLVAALRMPVLSVTRWLRDWRDARLWDSNKAALLVTLKSWSKPGNGRGQWSVSGEHGLAGSSVDQAAILTGFLFDESPGLIQVPERTVMTKDGGMAVDLRLGIARDLIAGWDGLAPREPISARTFEIGVTSPARPMDHLKLDLGEGVEESGDDFQGIVAVVDVRAQSEGISALDRAEYVAVPPCPPPDEAVAPAVEDPPDVVDQAGPVPARRRLRRPAAIESGAEIAGVTVHMAGASGDRDDQDSPPGGSVIHTAPGGVRGCERTQSGGWRNKSE